jgi:hypothetical protein
LENARLSEKARRRFFIPPENFIMPDKNKSAGDSGKAVATGSEGGVMSTFMKPASILFVLAFLALGGVVLLFLKFRSMDAQVRRLTEQVSKAPSEQSFKMLQEEWAIQFHQKQIEQHSMILDRMQAIQDIAESTRVHLHEFERGARTARAITHGCADNCPDDCPEDCPENCPEECLEGQCPCAPGGGDGGGKDEAVESAHNGDSDDDMPQVDKGPLVEQLPAPTVRPGTDAQPAQSDSPPTQSDPVTQPAVDAELKQPAVDAQSDQLDAGEPMPQPRKKGRPRKKTPETKQEDEILESSMDLDADESEVED